jgi:hypothetical protein
VLYFASAPAPKADTGLRYLRRRFPGATISVVACPDFARALGPGAGARLLFAAGQGEPRAAFLGHAWRRRFDVVAVLTGGDPGYLSMKLAALLTRPRQCLLCINENADAYEWRLGNARLIARHARWRLGQTGGSTLAALVSDAALRAWSLTFGELVGTMLLLGKTARLMVRRRWGTRVPGTQLTVTVVEASSGEAPGPA